MKYWLFIINNFLHDLFTGLWVSSLIVIIYFHNKKAAPEYAGFIKNMFREIRQDFFWVGVLSLSVVIGTGIIRFIYYNRVNDISEQSEGVKKKLLIIKHILLGLMIFIGMAVEYCLAFKG